MKSSRGAWNKEEDGEQWAHLGRLIAERDPQRIGLNYSDTWSQADGIAHSEYELFRNALPEQLHDRIVSAEMLAVGWLETRNACGNGDLPAHCKNCAPDHC